MQIGINLLYLRPAKVGGSEIYIRELIRHIEKKEEIKLVLFCNKEVASSFSRSNSLELIILSSKNYSLYNKIVSENLGLRKYLNGLDLLFSPANFAIPFLSSKIPQVITVHDMQHLSLKKNFSYLKRIGRSAFFKLSFLKCQHIISISDFTKQDILTNYNVSPNLVTTIYNGVDKNITIDKSDISQLLNKFGLKNDFFLFPAMSAPHKNHMFLIEAFAKFKILTNSAIELIFTGDRGNNGMALENRINSSGVSDCIRHLGYLKHNEVLFLMTAAKALLFPSKFEGFGLPILEAMHCGTPVIASNATAIPEIAGNAAILLDPDDHDEWVNAMKEIIINDDLRKNLIKKGYENIRKFSWDLCAEQTIEVFNKCISK